MIDDQDPDQIAQEMCHVSHNVDRAFALTEVGEIPQEFVFKTTHLLTTDEMVSLCRDMAVAVRRRVPERPDQWAAVIHAEQFREPDPMGYYYIGWTGHDDKWHLCEGQERKETDHGDWLALRERLRTAMGTLGTERPHRDRKGDFRVSDLERPGHTLNVYVHRPEFLTRTLIATIQNALKDGSAEWTISIVPCFGERCASLFRGIDIRADGVTERWDRQEAEELLGDRLKI